MKKLLSLLVISLLCACGGTETGNPAISFGPANPGAGTSNSLASEKILSALCAKLDACYSNLTLSQCEAGILPQTDIAAALGLPSGFGSYQSIINSETSGAITPNSSALTVCLSDISNLTCGQVSVTTAYNPASPSDFTNVVNMIPQSGTSCGGVF